MIQCKHKWEMIASNRGLRTWFCEKFMEFVNEARCSECEFQEGTMVMPPKDMPFPVKNDEEIQIIQNVCEGCPLFRQHDKRCDKLPAESQPTDIWGAHPNNHCPEDKW